MMNVYACSFTNELGNRIEMQVNNTDREVIVHAVGPTSEVNHTWTHLEAQALLGLLESWLHGDRSELTHG